MGAAPDDPAGRLVDELCDLAVAAATAAGRLLHEGRPERLAWSTKSSPTDVVTEMDRAAERLLVEHLLGARPDDGLLGEEGGERPGRSGVRWVVDPLDGTVNYLYGLPQWGVAVAAEVAGTAVVGAVACPALGETYLAAAGRGALMRDAGGSHPLHCSTVPELPGALVATGFGYTVARRRAQARVVAQVLPAVRDIRRGGAASIDLCGVAAGRLDGYYERGLQPWDLAAAGVVAREAGAVVAGLGGRPAGPDLVVAAGPRLFPALHDLLAGLRADTD